jgi:hypothetical protein
VQQAPSYRGTQRDTINETLFIKPRRGFRGRHAIRLRLGNFIYPFWFLNDVAMETMVGPEIPTTITACAIVRVIPTDLVRWAR